MSANCLTAPVGIGQVTSLERVHALEVAHSSKQAGAKSTTNWSTKKPGNKAMKLSALPTVPVRLANIIIRPSAHETRQQLTTVLMARSLAPNTTATPMMRPTCGESRLTLLKRAEQPRGCRYARAGDARVRGF